MINIFAAIGLAIKVLSKESGVTLLEDARTLYPYLKPFQAGKLNFLAMHKAGTLMPALKALQRTVNAIVAALEDKVADKDLVEVLESLPSD